MRRSGELDVYEGELAATRFAAGGFSRDQRIVGFGVAGGGLLALLGPLSSAAAAREILVEIVPHGGDDRLLGPQKAKRIEGIAEDDSKPSGRRRHVPLSAFRAAGLSGPGRALF